MTASITSPCVKACRLDEQSVCSGCGRTLQEIAGWSAFSDEDRKAVLQRLDNIKRL